MRNIRNFSIIAHIDHGKSTLADRMLELTGTVEARKMREQVLDEMELERERGITIKMTPVTMQFKDYILNLIDTPGHIDFAYEVSRSLKAVEGALLLVDATQGVQAQTLSVLDMAREEGLAIIPAVSKIDSHRARTDEVKNELASLLGIPAADVLGVSGKTGDGVPELLDALAARIPQPREPEEDGLQALVFDYEYREHRGIVMYVRLFCGEVRAGDELFLAVTGARFKAVEVGRFTPKPVPAERLGAGEVGYIVSGIKEPDKAVVGDTIVRTAKPAPALPGYREPQPVVWASLYPESQEDFSELKSALLRLKLSDAALTFEEESSPALGRGFLCGFLGMLHLEVELERLRREFGLSLVVTSSSVAYKIHYDGAADGPVCAGALASRREKVYSPLLFPEHGTFHAVYEPWVAATIMTPHEYVGGIMQMLHRHEAEVGASQVLGGQRMKIEAAMPLRELMRGVFDELKSVSSGFASLSYVLSGEREANVTRLDILVAEEPAPAFSQIVPAAKSYEEAKAAVERLYGVLPRQLFPVKIQGKALGRILSSKTLPALKKNVTGHLYGGDITRKRKLWEKQKKGKKKLKERGKVEIPHDVFLKMIKRSGGKG